MEPHESASTLNEFLHRFLDDRDRGRIASLEEYQATFPEAADAIATEYERLTSTGDAEAASPDAMAERQSSLGGGSRIGPYRIVRRLGRGSFGLVFLAEDVRLARQVALKLLARAGLESDRERALFEREAGIASRLDHPGICTVFDVGRHGIWTWIAMRYIPGETLAERLTAPSDRLTLREILTMIEKVARALDVAHETGVVHRDVKPGNIMVTPDGEPIVVDFGLARDRSIGAPTLTLSGEATGTPAYMSPEQIDSARGVVDHRTDVWSLGVTLYEAVTGERPFDSPTQAGLFRAILDSEPPAPVRDRKRVGRDLAIIIQTALAKDRERRYESAAGFADDLRRLMTHEPIRARPMGLASRTFRWARRNRLVAALLVVVTGLFIGGIATTAALLARARTNLEDWERLADGRKLEELERIARDELVPIVPEKADAMEPWLAAARALVARLDDHRQALESMRRRARPETESTRLREERRREQPRADLKILDLAIENLRLHRANVERVFGTPESRRSADQLLKNRLRVLAQRRAAAAANIAARTVFDFDDDRDQLQHDRLADLIAGLERFAFGGPGVPSLLANVEDRLATARGLRARTIDSHREAWNAAIDRVSRNPLYRGLILREQVGLIPIGCDPSTTLEEFVDGRMGAIPTRDERRQFRVESETAIVFVLLPGGTLTQGAQRDRPTSPQFDPASTADEIPLTTVPLDPFFIGKFEVTQGQWMRWLDDLPSGYEVGASEGGEVVDLRHPVESVSWHDCTYILRAYGFSLPTEAQWEYACRAGTGTPYFCREDELFRFANLADMTFDRVVQSRGYKTEAWDDGRYLHAPVGVFRANGFGLHDILGNVSEWCLDCYGNYAEPARRGDGLRDGADKRYRAVRGSSWIGSAAHARSASRNRTEPGSRGVSIGLRVARALSTP